MSRGFFFLVTISVFLRALLLAGAGSSFAATPDTLSTPPARVKSPYKAMLCSALLPGGGQFYTENRGKGFVLLGVESVLLGATVLEHRRTENHWREYVRSGNSQEYELYLQGYDRRSRLLWWTGGAWAFSIADAYIDAYLYRFDAEEKLTLMIQPVQPGPSLSIQLRW